MKINNSFYLIMIFYLSVNLYSQQRLTLVKSKDLGNLSPLFEKKYFIEIRNETKDTFFITSMYLINKIPMDIWFKGNNLYSNSEFYGSMTDYPRIVYPNEIRRYDFTYVSQFEDSVSIKGKKLSSSIIFIYQNYNNNKIILRDSINLNISSKREYNKIITSSGVNCDFATCPEYKGNYEFQSFSYIKNTFQNSVVLDSIYCLNCDTIINIYGIVNIHQEVQKLPMKIERDSLKMLGWYFKPLTRIDKKVYLKYFFNLSNTNSFSLLDSIYVNTIYEKDCLISNGLFDKIDINLNDSVYFKNKIFLSSCSNRVNILDSITFSDWDNEELVVSNDFGLPLRVEIAFNYTFNYKFKASKIGEKNGRIYFHFHDDNANYFYRYCNLNTKVNSINNVDLTKDTPLAFYPNPANSLATLLLDEEPSVGEKVCIYNSLGTLVKTLGVSDKYTQVNTEGMAEGVYIARLLWSGKSVKFCVVR